MGSIDEFFVNLTMPGPPLVPSLTARASDQEEP